jgi:site-specific recombinase XerD
MLLFFPFTLLEKEKPMLEHGFARPSVITRLRGGPLGPHLETLATTLHQRGYARNSIRGYLRACAQFGRWLAQQGYPIAEVDATLVTRYLRGLPQPPVGRSPKAAAGLPHLLTLWQQQGLLPPAAQPPPRTAADPWLEHYTQYLEHVCGTAASTRTRYLRIITRFLSAYGDTRAQGWSALQAQDMTTFIHREAAATHGAGRKMPSVAVRSFLRFLVGCGELSPGLEAAAPTARQWTHAPLPQRLTAEEVERVLVTSSGATPKALRNHALLRLLARLGLRAHEVAALCLDDLDWYEGRIRIRPGKTHQARVLPLVQDVGQAIAAYLERGRPATTSRHVFLAGRAPFQPLTDATAISRITTRALQRAGVTSHLRLGAHTFRHTAAAQMVNRGARFKEVADVLGHRALQTTGIYAKLDLDALVAVALPWMGEPL